MELILWKGKVSRTKWRRTSWPTLLLHPHSSLVDPEEAKHRRPPLPLHILLFKDLQVVELRSWEIEAWKAKGSTIKNAPDPSLKAAVEAEEEVDHMPKIVLAPEDLRELVENLETLKW